MEMRFRSILITICGIMCISIAIGLASSVWDKKPKAKKAKYDKGKRYTLKTFDKTYCVDSYTVRNGVVEIREGKNAKQYNEADIEIEKGCDK